MLQQTYMTSLLVNLTNMVIFISILIDHDMIAVLTRDSEYLVRIGPAVWGPMPSQ